MTLSLSTEAFRQFKTLIEDESGIVVSDEKEYLIETRLAKMVMDNGCESYDEFYRLVKAGNDTLKTKIVDAMTTNETLWFRDEKPYRLLETVILPELAEKRDRIRIWSAACSTGQEPYSIAMVALSLAKRNPKLASIIAQGRFQILATDLSSSALFLAKNGRYDKIAMSRGFFDESYKTRFFTEDGRVACITDEVKKLVDFRPFNLKHPFVALGESFDVVFIRNVAIYFSLDFKRELFGKIRHVLNQPGYLLLGASESLVGISQDFTFREGAGGGTYYERQVTGGAAHV
jgi:chemotaxis protein methyltransferase CheR